MPINAEAQNKKLYSFLQGKQVGNLQAKGLNDKSTLDTSEAIEFTFDFKFNNRDVGNITATADNGKISVYFLNNVSNPRADAAWSRFLKDLKNWGLTHGFTSFDFDGRLDDLNMYRQEKVKQKREEQLLEGYYGTKNTSYSDSAPRGIKLIIKHNRSLNETDKRFHHIERIFLETEQGERLLLNTKKPSVARAYARHIAEGGEYNDERWRHINELAQDVQNLSGFVRATKSNQFNESVQQVVTEAINHYLHLRETIHRLQSSRGYNKYFENWQPALMETSPEQDFAGMFQTSRLDPRIERALPVLSKLNIRVNDLAETREFEKWANSVVEGHEPAVDEKIDELAELLSKEKIPVGQKALSLKTELDDLIDDRKAKQELFAELDELSYNDPNADAKPAIMAFVIKNSDDDFFREVNSKVESGDITSKEPGVKKVVKPKQKSQPAAPQVPQVPQVPMAQMPAPTAQLEEEFDEKLAQLLRIKKLSGLK